MYKKKFPIYSKHFIYLKKKEIHSAYTSKIISNWEKQIILLMISNIEKESWHYVEVKKYICIITWNNIRVTCLWGQPSFF